MGDEEAVKFWSVCSAQNFCIPGSTTVMGWNTRSLRRKLRKFLLTDGTTLRIGCVKVALQVFCIRRIGNNEGWDNATMFRCPDLLT